MKMIDVDRGRIPIWLLWAQTTNGLVTLAAVAMTNSRATAYRKIILCDANVVNVKIEPSEANHLFNPDWDSQWQSAYGESHLKHLAQQVESIERKAKIGAEHERDQALVALQKAKSRIEELERNLT